MPARKSSRTSPAKPAPRSAQPAPSEEIVDPIWLLKGLGLTLIAAIICAWLALCLLYYQGSWQLVLHHSPTVDVTPASAGIPFEEVRFDTAETGQPRLSGWWIPAAPDARYAYATVLYLHDGSGSLSAAVPTLKLLHTAGLNIFAMDYRGFGRSEHAGHPTSGTMTEDASASLTYLLTTRHLPASAIVLYGSGLGGSLAANLALGHADIPAVILDNPDPDPTATAIAAHPSGIVPIRLLYHEHFDIAGPLSTLRTPKLLIDGGPNARPTPGQLAQLENLFRTATSPHLAVSLPAQGFESPYEDTLARFLDQYLPTRPPAH